MTSFEEKFGLNSFKKIKEFQKPETKFNKILSNDSLPDWFKTPIKLTETLKSVKVKDFSLLDKQLRTKLKQNKIKRLFPIQECVLPYLLVPHNPYFYLCENKSFDICVCSPTGSGKTLSFVLPIIQALHRRLNIFVRALVLAPVTDLARQIYTVFKDYSSHTDLSIALLGAGSVAFHKEQKKLIDPNGNSLVDIVISTPGRLVDHLKYTNGFNLNNLRFLVIDEADRMLRDDKQQWIMRVPTLKGCQKLLFSATLTHEPDKLLAIDLFKPKLFTWTDEGHFIKPSTLKEFYVLVDENVRPLAVVQMILNLGYSGVLCFVNSVLSANRLCLLLTEYGICEVAVLTSKQPPAKRTSILNKFNSNNLKILICSDVATRGIDFGAVHYVISYDYCKHMKTYIHRVGRTARAGLEGTGIILLNRTQLRRFRKQSRLNDETSKNVKEMKLSPDDINKLAKRLGDVLQNISSKLNRDVLQNISR